MKIREESEGVEFITVIQSFDTHIELIFWSHFSRKNIWQIYIHTYIGTYSSTITEDRKIHREQPSFCKVVGGKNELIIDNDKNNNRNNEANHYAQAHTQSNWGCRWMIGK